MTLQEANNYLKTALNGLYEPREAATIADWVMEKLTGLNKIDRLVKRDHILDEEQSHQLKEYLADLLSNRPVQYVLGEADFFGLKFFVNENVLIPRPETEELVAWILDDHPAGLTSLLDVGTGSGCIAVALKSRRPSFKVAACDISAGAISVASANAAMNKANVDLFLCDILNTTQTVSLPIYDIIVSNPPYIPPSGKSMMSANVIDFEPHNALFTPGEDPYLFYRAIASLGLDHLTDKGKLYFEIHEEGAEGVRNILVELGYKNIEARKDLYDRPRMITAERQR